MKNNQKAIYNEPLIDRKGDLVPQFAKVEINNLPELVRARLEIENNAMFCPLGGHTRDIIWTNAHRQIVRIMLAESDSPFSSRLRANAAGLAGSLGIIELAPALKKMGLNEIEDVNTRINSISSLVKLAETDSSVDVQPIFRTGDSSIRLFAYRATMNSSNKKINDLGRKLFAKETNKTIIDLINKSYKPDYSKESTVEKLRNKTK
jgi:hypothetical protein